MDHIFRQYDIRGKMGSELLLEDIPRIGKAIAYYFLQKNPHGKTIAIGADGRIDSPRIKELLCKALQESGFNVIFIGVCATPVLYFSLFNLPVDGGLMITASHNGKEYNGIKICLGKDSIWGEQIQDIKELVHRNAQITNANKGSYSEYALIPDYIAWMAQHFTHLKNIDLSMVLDCGNGAAGTIIPDLIKAMQWKHVNVLYAEVDGTFPHHEPDPTFEKNMRDVKRIVQTTDAILGIGFDGDCDRMACMTKQGELVQGDKLLALFSKEILQHNPGATIVFDVKCSSGLIELLEQWGATAHMSPTGHSIIKNQMKLHHALLAGELSCHFFFNDRYFGYDDGVYAALRLIEILVQTKESLDSLLSIFPRKINTPEIKIVCKEEEKKPIVENIKNAFLHKAGASVNSIDGVRVTLPYGWGILRASNTQPVLCLRFESDSVAGLQHIQDDFIMLLKEYFPEQFLRQQVYDQ